jgi:type I restriction-modification system DNA methylase subunit
LRQDGGFDVVVGNPPYGAEIDDQEKMYYLNTISFRLYQYNTYILFLGGVTHLLNNNGLLGLIVPDTWLVLDYCDGLREKLITENRIREIIYTGAIFDQVVVDTTIVILSSERQTDEQTLIRTVLKEGSVQDRLIRIAHGNWQVDEFVPSEKWSKNSLPDTFTSLFEINT